jgi:hypothetical protein
LYLRCGDPVVEAGSGRLGVVNADAATVQAAIGPVLADLERQHPGLVRVETTGDDPETSFWLWEVDGSGTGVRLSDGQCSADAVIFVADQVQEVACEALRGAGRAAAWPVCPDHPVTHPLAPMGLAGAAVWACPVSDRPVAPIGQLPAAAGS